MNTLKNILLTVTVVAFFGVIYCVGACEQGLITLTECAKGSLVWCGVMGICVYALNRLDD